MKRIALSFVILTISLSIFGRKTHTLWVNSIKTTNENGIPCYQIQENDTIDYAAWENLCDTITEFDYQPGHIYKIKVKDMTDDHSTFKLKRVKSKEVDPILRLYDMWAVINIGGTEITPQENSRKNANMEINLSEKRIYGSDGCNRYNADITYVDTENISFGRLLSTRMMCVAVNTPDLFQEAITKVEKYRIADLKLYLLDKEGNTLMSLKKID